MTGYPLTTPAQLAELARQLRAGKGGDIGKELRSALLKAADPVAAEARAAVRNLRIVGDRRSGPPRRPSAWAAAHRGPPLRASIADAVVVRTLPDGVRIEVDAALMPPSLRVLPPLTELVQGWMHQVFGNRAVRARSRGGPWFYPTMDRNTATLEDAMRDALDRAAEQLAQKVKGA